MASLRLWASLWPFLLKGRMERTSTLISHRCLSSSSPSSRLHFKQSLAQGRDSVARNAVKGNQLALELWYRPKKMETTVAEMSQCF